MNLLWADVETSGLNEDKNDVIQLACIPVIDGIPQASFNEYCQPTNWNTVDPVALQINNITLEQLKTFQPQSMLLDKFINFISVYNVKFGLAGHNIGFDKKFLFAMFKKHNRQADFFKIFNLDIRDTLQIARSLKGKLKTENNKLETLAKHFNVPINAHNALSDITANIEVDKELSKLTNENTNIKVDTSVNFPIPTDLPEPAQLHLHSQYCMVDAVPMPDEWGEWCDNNNIPGFSILDHGSAISLYYAVKNKRKAKFVPGVGLNFKFYQSDEKFYRINAWATTKEGYFNLMNLCSMGYEYSIEVDKVTTPIITVDDIQAHRSGIRFGMADTEGFVGDKIKGLNRTFNDVKEAYLLFLELFGQDSFVEFNPIDITREFDKNVGFKGINNNDLIIDGNIQKAYNTAIFELLQYGGVPIPVSGASFIEQDDKIIQDCLCKNSLKDGKYYEESYHAKKSKDLYIGLKRHLGVNFNDDIYRKWVENTINFLTEVEEIEVKFDYHLPKIDFPAYIKNKTADYDKQLYLFTLEKVKEHGRWNDSDLYKKRFAEEIDVIMRNKAMNFLPYFLMYEDFGKFVRDNNFLQNIARGSAGGSLLSYYLKIIHIDPIKNDLPFSRFLSHARINAGSWPDIDMDISRSARPHLMKYLKDKYGRGFAQIATFSTMKTKNAIKDAMWALYGKNRRDFEVDAVCKTIPDSPQGVAEDKFLYGYEDEEGEYHQGQLDTNIHLQNFFKVYPDIERMVKRLIGVVRGWSRHASAFVVSTIDLPKERIPTMSMYDKYMNESIYVTQMDSKMVEKCGLVKADILGLKTLDCVSDAVKMVKDIDYLEQDANGVDLIFRLPEDQKVYIDFYNKKTDSSFQFNTGVIKQCIRDYCPTNRESLSALTAIKRPGAMDVQVEDTTADKYYTLVKNGEREARYIHPDLEPILKETNGLFIYQESVMKCLVEICDMTWEETDIIRSAIAKKKAEVIMSTFTRIREATAKRGWTEEQSNELCQSIQAFSRYSFNRSHSRAYSELGYITMYLKHHHPLEWWCSVLNSEDEEDKIRYYIYILGNLVKPASLKYPADRFVIKDNHIVAPIKCLKGVGAAVYQELTDKGPFVDLKDFCNRVDHRKVNIGAVSKMIMARAVDDFFDPKDSYVVARNKFIEEYSSLRDKKFKDESIHKYGALEIFLMERSVNTVFNKTLLSDDAILEDVLKRWNGLERVANLGIPLKIGDTFILNGVRVAEGLLEKNYIKEVGMIALYGGAETRSGVSKKTGKNWSCISLKLNDGYVDFEATDWLSGNVPRLPIDSLVFIRGKITTGFKSPIGINITEIEPIK